MKIILLKKNSSMRRILNCMISIVLLVICTSCTVDNDCEENKFVQNESGLIESNLYESESYYTFVNAIDSVNSVYDYVYSRGSFGSVAGTTMADYMGYASGRYIGSWVGGAIGSLSANPFGSWAGAVIGGKIGPAICGSLASGIASIFLSDDIVLVDDDCFTTIDMTINEAFELCDSTSVYHNLCMKKLWGNRVSYGNSNSLNREKIYDDVIQFYRSYGMYDSIYDNKNLKKFMLDEIDVICQTSKQYKYGQLSSEQFIDTCANYLSSKVHCSKTDVTRFKDFESKIIIKCSTLNKAEIHLYAYDLKNVIEASTLPSSTKEVMAKSADFIINSSLCWNQ